MSDNLKIFDDMSFDDIIEIENQIFKCMDDNLTNDILQISNPIYKEKLHSIITDEIYETIASIYDLDEYDEAYDDILEFVKESVNTYTDTIMTPPRSCNMDYSINKTRKEIDSIRYRIECIKRSYQPPQRTAEWYEYRHNLLTASNVGKVIGSDAKRNSLIYEKCQPLLNQEINTYVNVNSPMHWGNKYEPVSLMLYEHMFNTIVEDFGCIKHSSIDCLGASPDGINTDTNNSKLYGRMLEIKNIVNREITGIPLEAYWIQMQIQMEVCNLDECDFLETKFKEFISSDEFYSSEKEYTGIILYFISINDTNFNPHYVYMPITISKNPESIASWVQDVTMELDETHKLHLTIYWYLDIISCVLVPRNTKWFSALCPQIVSTWETIKNERKNGYEHRKPKKRNMKCNVILDDTDKCIIYGDTKIINLSR